MLIIKFVYNNNYYILVKTLSFYLIYNYYLEIYYKIKNNFTKQKTLLTQKHVKQLQDLKKNLIKNLKNAIA